MFSSDARRACAIAAALVLSAACSHQARGARSLERGKRFVQSRDYARAVLEFQSAAQHTPLAGEPYFQLGLVYLALDNRQMALAALRRAIENDPKLWPAQVKVAEILSDSVEHDLLQEAEQRARMAIQHLGDGPDSLNALAAAEWKLGKPAEAEAHLRQAFERFPSDWNSAISLAKIQLRRGERSAAEQTLTEAAGREPASANTILALAEFYLAHGRYDEARGMLVRATTIDPSNATALIDLGALYTREGRMQEASDCYRRVSELGRPQYRGYYALFLLHSGERDRGIVELQKLHRSDRSERISRSLLVGALLSANRASEGERILKDALRHNPGDVDAQIQMTAIYLQQSRLQEAMDSLLAVIRARPDLAEAHYLLAQVHDRRRASLSQKAELEDALRLNVRLLEARIALSRYYLKLQAYRAALDIMEQAPPDQRSLTAFVQQRNWALLASGETKEARLAIDAALQAQQNPTLLVQKAIVHLREGRIAPALTAIELALRAAPEDLRALNLLVACYRLENREAAGLAAARSVAEANTASPVVQRFLGDLLSAHGDRAGARKAYETVKALAPAPSDVDLALARLDFDDGRMDDARGRLRILLAADPANAGAHFLLGWIEESAGNYSQAAYAYTSTVERDPFHVAAANNLAFLLAHKLGKPTEALKFAQKAKELAPDNPEVTDTLGWIYYQERLYTSAIRHLEVAASASGSAEHRFHLAMAYWRAGRRAEARNAFAAGMRLDPTRPEAAEAKQVFSEP
jgi:tetratricopeptide (TPR) repeat protein